MVSKPQLLIILDDKDSLELANEMVQYSLLDGVEKPLISTTYVHTISIFSLLMD